MLKMRDLGINLVPAGERAAAANPLYMTWSNCDGCTTTGGGKKGGKKGSKTPKPKTATAGFSDDAVAQLRRQLDGHLNTAR